MRQLIKISSVSLCFNSVIAILNFVIGLVFLKKSQSALVFGSLIIIGPIISLILSPLIARIIDKYDKRLILVIVQIMAVAMLGFSAGYAPVYESLLFNYVLVVLLRIVSEILVITLRSAIPMLVANPSNYQRFNAAEQTATAMANVIGPSVGGILFALLTFSNILWVSVAILMFALGITLTIRFKKDSVFQDEGYGMAQNFIEIIQYVYRTVALRDIMMLAAITNFFSALISIGLPYVLISEQHMDSTSFGLVESLSSFGMVVTGGVLVIIQVKQPLKFVYKVMSKFYIVFVLFTLPLISHSVPNIVITMFAFGNVLFGISAMLVNTPMTTYLQNSVPLRKQGAVYTLLISTSQIFMPVASIMYGILFDSVNSLSIFAVSTAIVFLVSMYSAYRVKRQ